MEFANLSKEELLKKIEELQNENNLLKGVATSTNQQNSFTENERKLLYLMVEAIPIAAAYIEEDKLFLNRAAEDLTGYKSSDLGTVSDWFGKLFDNDEEIIKIYNDSKGKGFLIPSKLPISNKRKEKLYIEFTGYKYAECEIWMMHDITELSKLENSFDKSDSLFNCIFKSLKDIIIFSLDRNYCYTAFTAAHKVTMKQIWGLDIAVGMNMLDVITDPRDREKAKINFDRTLSGEKFVISEEYGSDKLHRTFWENRYSPICGDNKEILGLTVFVIDFTERMKIESKLSENEKITKTIFDSAPILIWMADEHSEGIFFNKQWLEFRGRTFEEEAGLGWLEGIHPEDFDSCKEKFVESFNNREPIQIEYRLKRGDGKYCYMLDQGIPRFLPNGEFAGFVGTCVEISHIRKVEEDLLESRNSNRAILAAIPDILFMFSRDGFFIDHKAEDGNMLFLAADKFINKNITEVLPADIANLTLENIEKVALTGEAQTYDYSLDIGGLKYFESRLVPYGKDSFLAIVRDITEKKEAESKLRKLSSAVEQSPASVIIADIEGNIEYVNPKCCEVTGFKPEELLGKNPRIFKSGETSLEEYEDLWSSIKSGNEWRGEFHNEKKNGELFWELASISPIRDENGQITHFLSIKEDITFKKEMETLLRKALDKAEESSRLKSNLLNNMSHELRTPMNGILGFASILQSEVFEPMQKELLGKLIQSSKRLMSTLNLILDYSQVESNSLDLKLKNQSLNKLIELVIPIYTELAQEKNLTLLYSPKVFDAFSNIDERFLTQVVDNLVDNAIKFTSQGEITIIVDTIMQDGKRWNIIKVKDTGIGIDEQTSKLIFQEFRQVSEGTSRHFEGSGLGLTLAKKISELMKGKITLESHIGKGSEFTLWFPSDEHNKELVNEAKIPESVIPEKVRSVRPHSGKLPVVLLIEDQMLNIQVTELYLKSFCEIDYALNVDSGLRKVKDRIYDGILMDINLGLGMSGTQAAKIIRKMQGYEHTPIIACTGYAMHGDKEKFLAEGFDAYIPKPFDQEMLIQSLYNLGIGANRSDNN